VKSKKDMTPGTPLPEGSEVRIPVDAKLKEEWRYDPERRLFRSETGKRFSPRESLPKGSRIVYKAPILAEADPDGLSEAERDLRRYIQIILPKGKSAKDFVEEIRDWPCLQEAELGPDVSLPGGVSP